MNSNIYPRTNDFQTIYLNTVIKNPAIIVGDYTIYNDFVNDPVLFEKNNVLYHYPINKDRLIIGKFCSIACGAKFLFNSANHTLNSLSNYTFPIFFEEWNLDKGDVTSAWDNKGDIVIGNDVWIGYEAVIMAGVHIGNVRMAAIWAENSYCKRRQVGALLVKDKMIISDGYNGTPAGFENVCEDENNVTKPYVLHAEANAITKVAASSNSSKGATIYVTSSPCIECAKLIIQSGIKRVVYSENYRIADGCELLKRAGIIVDYIDLNE